jgi:hypothetical protein
MVNILRLSTRIDINTFMTSVRTALLAGVLLFITNFSIAQRDKEGSYVAPGANTVVNTYTYLTVNAAAGTNTLTVNNNSMNGGVFGGALAPGDLVMIIQMQGASTDINTTPTTAWGGNYTIPNSYLTTWGVNPENFGGVTNYNQSGYHERREVLSVSGGNSITLNCNLSYSYSASTAGISGHVQVVRIPRFTDLTVNTGTSIVPTLWDGNSGGIVALEVNGALTVNAGGSISASGYGFRGGELDASSLTATFETTSVRHLGSNDNLQGSEKGEGIGGYHVEYDALASRYGIGAVANGGGGGGYQNTGGGGGTNVMVGGGAYTGKGIPQGVPAVWDLETVGFGGSTSPGGGRGGYAYSNLDANATIVGPRDLLPFVADRIWFGGGGGAGDQDSDEGGAGGRGGGIVFMYLYGSIAGSGTIEANGEDGENSNSTGATAVPADQTVGNDGAGGGGGGGTIQIENIFAFPASMFLNVIGGNGGNQVLDFYDNPAIPGPPAQEASGPGGSGSGGYIRITSGAAAKNLTAGANGTTNSSHLTEFPANGATEGSDGFPFMPANPAFNIIGTDQTICAGTSTTANVALIGSALGTVTWFDAMVGGTQVGTGNSYNTPVLGGTVTYWVGVCPGSFREQVTITITPLDDPSYNYAAVMYCVTDPDPTPSITGLAGGGFTSSPAGLVTNAATGQIDVSASTPAVYTITYTTTGPCPSSSDFVITIDPCGLPIEFGDFWVECNEYPVLHWESISEYNNGYFTIERSCDLDVFEEIALVDGLENSVVLTEYIYMDNERTNCEDENVYYRLSQTDLNGHYKLLGVLFSNCDSELIEPTYATMDNAIRIQYSERFDVRLYTADGRLIDSVKSNGNQLDLNTNGLSPGVYIIHLNSTQSFSWRVVITK